MGLPSPTGGGRIRGDSPLSCRGGTGVGYRGPPLSRGVGQGVWVSTDDSPLPQRGHLVSFRKINLYCQPTRMGPITAFVQMMFAVIRRSLSSSLVSDIAHSKNQSSVSVTSYMHGSCSAVRVVACVAFVDISHDNAFTSCVLKSTLLNACVSLRFSDLARRD